jgi:hypothetical protein
MSTQAADLHHLDILQERRAFCTAKLYISPSGRILEPHFGTRSLDEDLGKHRRFPQSVASLCTRSLDCGKVDAAYQLCRPREYASANSCHQAVTNAPLSIRFITKPVSPRATIRLTGNLCLSPAIGDGDRCNRRRWKPVLVIASLWHTITSALHHYEVAKPGILGSESLRHDG